MRKLVMTRHGALLVSACALMLAYLGEGYSTSQDDVQDTKGRVGLLSEHSHPHSILYNVFRASGWSGDEAVLLAENGLARLGVEGYSVNPVPDFPAGLVDREDVVMQSLLPPDADPFTLIVDAFHQSGWSFAEAYLHAHRAFVKLGVRGFQQKPRISDPFRFLQDAFHESGWGWSEAGIHANNALARLGTPGYETKPAPVTPVQRRFEKGERGLLSPQSETFAIMLRVLLEMNWTIAEAYEHVVSSLEQIGVELQNNPKCQVRAITVQYCEDDDVKFWVGWVKELCYQQLFLDVSDPENPVHLCEVPHCPNETLPWYTMTMKDGCDFPFVGCVRIDFGLQVSVPCETPRLGCECFEEQSCEDIQTVQCCEPYVYPGTGGCTGCPCFE